jgi:hypothetical protein
MNSLCNLGSRWGLILGVIALIALFAAAPARGPDSRWQ